MAKPAKKTKAAKATKSASLKRTKLPKRKTKASKAKKAPKLKKKKIVKATKRTTTKKKIQKTRATSSAPRAAALKKASTLRTKAATTPLIREISAVEPITTAQLQVGEAAPNFTLQNQSGEPITLSQYQGRKVVLYFYPKDDTPGCTKEACSFRDNIGLVDSSDAIILGVSFDDQASHQKFIEKFGLNFQLLSDLDKSVAQAYGVYVQKNMYGNLTWGIERSTFVIDREGKIAKIFRKVSVDGHTEEILESLRQIS